MNAAARVVRQTLPPRSRTSSPPTDKPLPSSAPPSAVHDPEEQHLAMTLKELGNGAREFGFEVRSAMAHAELLATCGHPDIEGIFGSQVALLRRFANYARLFDECATELAEAAAD